MRSKAPLALMEQVVMILVFALSAALCLKVFAFSDQVSMRNEAVDRAVLEAQNAAEAMKNGNAAYFGKQWIMTDDSGDYAITYDENWRRVSEDSEGAAYMLTAEVHDETVWMWTGEVVVCTAEGEKLFSLPVAGQKEVAGYGA